MPAHVKTANASQQNQKHAQKTQKQRFANGYEIREALKTQNQEVLLQNLTTLRNQISLKATEDVLAPNDERLLLAQNWLEQGENGKEILELWDSSGPKQSSLISLLLSILSALLDLLSHHYPFQTTGHFILKTLLSPQYVRRLNAYIGGSQNELILLTLKLYNSMSNFAGGREKKLVLESFAWEMKSLPKLMSMRRKTKPGENTDSLQRPDIRTLYILFLLSFLAPTTVAAIKTTFLEQHRDQFLLIFKGLNQDSYSVIRKITEVCWTGIWGDAKIKRTLKISLFNESTLGHIHKLYERSNPEQDNPEYIPADLIHHFLLAICTRPGVGICFKDHGWYPRDTELDTPAAAVDLDVPDKHRGGSAGKIYNKILSNFVKTLKVNEDARQQELALRILASCPELVAGYWPTASLALEPRLSSKWITNVAYFGTVVSLPIPTSCFLLESTKGSEASMYKPTPPPLNAILSSFLPSSIPTKLNFTKGLQSSSGLVQHCTAVALAKCLSKYESVIQAFKDVEAKLEEVEGEGQWSKRRKEMEREARRRVPEFQVIVSFSQSKFGLEAAPATTNPTATGDRTVVQQEPNEVKAAMLSEVAYRLLWMYHRCLPGLVAEARFDVGKLLVQCGFTEIMMNDQRDDDDGEEEEEEEESDGGVEGVAMEGVESTGGAGTRQDDDSSEADEEAQEPDLDKPEQLSLLKGLHVLRLLKESEQFVWSAKSGTSGETYFATLLKAYALSRSQSSTRVALAELLQHVLSQSILFQEDPSEAALWLLCLPTYRRRPGTSAPDDAPLEDEIDAVVAFLDDCVQRCLKTPYKYIEELYAVAPSSSSSDGEDVTMGERSAVAKLDVYPSPLLMTVLEQLSIKVQKKLLSPSAVLALATFTRKLGFRLLQKLEDKRFLVGVCQRMEVMLKEENLFPEFSVMTAAIRRECTLLKALTTSEVVVGVSAPATSDDLHEFLDILEDMPIPVTPSGRENTAVELIDWVRLVGEELGSEEVKAVWDCLVKLDPSKLNDLVYALDPTFDILWSAIDHEELRERIEFDLLFVHLCHSRFFEKEEARSFAEATFVNGKDSRQMKRLMTMISHYLPRPSTSQQPALVAELMHLLALIFKSAKRIPEETSSLKELLFMHLNSIKEYLVWHQSTQEVAQGIQDLVHSSLDPSSAADQSLVSSVTAHWLHLVQSQVPSTPDQFALASLWLEYLPVSALLGLLDTFMPVQEKNKRPALQVILQVLNKSPWNSDVDAGIQQRLSLLVPLQDTMHDADDLDELIARGVTSSLPPYLDGAPFRRNTFDESSLVEVLRNARSRWQNLSGQLSAENPAVAFLKQDTWSKSTVAIAKGLIYRRSLPEGAFVNWLDTEAYRSIAVDAFVPVLRAVVDTSEWTSSGDAAVWEKQFDYALNAALNTKIPTDIRLSAAECLGPILRRISPTSSELVTALTKKLTEIQPKDFGVVATTIGMQLRSLREVDTNSATSAFVNAGVKWAIRASDQASSDEDGWVMDKLASLISGTKGIQSSLVETYLTVVIQERLSSESNLALAKALLSSTHLKPVVVNRHIQSIIQHPDFFKICSVSSPEKHSPRHGVIALLHALFCLHPTNTCQPSHVEPLVKVYQGRLSTADVQILSIFRLFEEERKTSISSLIGRWSPSKSTESATPSEAVQGLDPALVLRTTLNYPNWRKLHQVAASASNPHEEQLYDPVFLVLLFAQMLAEHPPNSALGWVEMFRSNIVGLVIRILSARDAGLRELALTQLAALWHHLESADLHEEPHVIHVLALLRDAIPPPRREEPPVRLPTYSTLLLAHALRGIFYPSNFIYPITARFLLQRPEIDTGDVPLLFSMLYSSSDDWKKERGWILRFLADGMVGSDDWRVLKRRHTWDLLASMYQASPDDRQLRAGIFEVLASLTCHPQATMSLVLRSSLLTWIESQLLAERVSDGVECVKILENIMTIADAERIEAATAGEWRATISRCLLKLLDVPDALPFVVSAILRLSLLPGASSSSPGSQALVAKAVECLERYEAQVKIPSAAVQVHPIRETQSPPYKAHEIHQPFTEGNDPLALWGHLVEALWRSTMNYGSKTGAWDRLTTRLLLWRALVGSDGSEIGEWARLQVVHSISSN